MDFEQLKKSVINWSPADQKALIMEVIPAIWANISGDEECFDRLRGLLDASAVRCYEQQHMGGI